jgi:hypothetical protein
VSSFESRLLVTAGKFGSLGIAGQAPEPERVATIPRLPAKAGAKIDELSQKTGEIA